MNGHQPRTLIPLLTTFAALAVTAAVMTWQSPASAGTGGAPIGFPRRAAAVIAAGQTHACARLSDGTVKCWGRNDHGQLGQGDTLDRGDELGETGDDLPPVDLGTGRAAIAITAGIGHTCAILDDHTVRCWGRGGAGQLGQGDATDLGDDPGELGDTLPAIDLGTGRTAIAIAAGGYHTCALLDDASVKCWGYNDFGELGQGTFEFVGDEPGEMGDNLAPVELGTGRTSSAIAAGLTHTCALLDDGSAKCWGGNTNGALGQGDTDDRGDDPGEMGDALPPIDLGTGRTAAAISAGISHTCALLDDGSVKCWGGNNVGQLGQGDTDARGDDPGEMGAALPAIDLGGGSAATSIAAAGNHNCAIIDVDEVKCWGANHVGQLGQGHNVAQGDNVGEMGAALASTDLGTGRSATAVAAGGDHSCALLDDLTLKCWGRNNLGQLGQGHFFSVGDNIGEMGDLLPTLDVGTQRTVVEVAVGAAHTCALVGSGTVKCWGDNASGQLGLGDTFDRGAFGDQMADFLDSVELGAGRRATGIAAGNAHTCALLDNGEVKCWGENGTGQLGQGSTADRGDGPGEMGDNLVPIDLGTGRTATAIAAAAGHTCALLDDATVKCWGQNASGQLGQGHTATRGDGPGEMGDNLDTVALGQDAVEIAAGQLHTCALLDGGDVICWGQNVLGQLGQEHANNLGDGPADVLDPVDLGTGRTAIAIATGGYHTCAALDDGTAKCWGGNGSGELGQGDTATRGDAANEMGDNLAAIALGTGRTAISVGGGLSHSCAVLDDGSAKCWGENGAGQLGLDNTNDRGDAANEMGDSLAAIELGTGRTVVAIAGGLAHTCARLDSTAVRCWGGNGQGQLGQGDVVARGDNFGEMAALLPVRLSANSHVSPIIDVPLAPTGVTAVAGVNSATLVWVTPTDDGGRPILGYRVQSAPTDSAVWTTRIENTGSPATSAYVTGLVAGAAIRFRAAAITVVGSGPYSAPSAAIAPTAAASPPLPPLPPLPPPAPGTGPAGKDLVTVPPARLLDTRQPNSTVDGLHAGGGPAPAGSITEVQITGRGGIPAGAIAAVVNATIVSPQADGFATAFGCTDAVPTASNLNYTSEQTIANNTIVKLSPTGSVCIYTDAAAHVLIDVNGYLPAASQVGSVAPARLLDTRQPDSTIDGLHAGAGPAPAGSITEVQIAGRAGVPSDAVAAIVNVTVVGPEPDGYATIFPCAPAPPMASNLNFAAGHDISNGAVAQLSPDGTLCIFTDATTDLLIDLNGYLPVGTTVDTLAPARLLDTRESNSTVDGLHAGAGPAPAGSITEVQVAGRAGVPHTATTALLNVTVVGAHADGYATVFGCATNAPTASNLNYVTGRDIPNNAITKLSPSGSVCIFTHATGHLLVDVGGYAS